MKRIAFALALVSMTAFAGAQTAKTQKLTGWIGDSKCGASMHTPECVKSCIKSGQKAVFVDSKNKVWAIENTDAVQQLLRRQSEGGRDRRRHEQQHSH